MIHVTSKRFRHYFPTCLILVFLFASSCVATCQGGLAGGPHHSVVIENGYPAIRFVSRDGSVALVYFRKHSTNTAFAVDVIDLDNFKQKSGVMYFTSERIIFESDDSEKRSFDVSTRDLKIDDKKPFFVIKHSGKEMKFQVRFSPPLSLYGKHQIPVFELIKRFVNDYETVASEVQQEAAKLERPTERRLDANPSTAPALQLEDAKVFVEVNSDPLGAEIYIDGTFAGSTPSKLSLKVGEHVIKVTRPGFKDWERRVIIAPSSSKSVNAILDRKR
jgi:hypothetical protein